MSDQKQNEKVTIVDSENVPSESSINAEFKESDASEEEKKRQQMGLERNQEKSTGDQSREILEEPKEDTGVDLEPSVEQQRAVGEAEKRALPGEAEKRALPGEAEKSVPSESSINADFEESDASEEEEKRQQMQLERNQEKSTGDQSREILEKPKEDTGVDLEPSVEQQRAVGEAEKRALLGEAEKRALLGEAEKRALLGEAEKRALLGEAEQRALLGEAEKRALLGKAEKRALPGKAEKRALLGEAEMSMLLEETEKSALPEDAGKSVLPEEANRSAFPEELKQNALPDGTEMSAFPEEVEMRMFPEETKQSVLLEEAVRRSALPEGPKYAVVEKLWTPGGAALIILIAIVFTVCANQFYGTQTLESRSPLQIFQDQFKRLQEGFPEQNHNLWLRSGKMLTNHLNKSNPDEPAMIILTAAEDTKSTLLCLGKGLAQTYAVALNSSWLLIHGPSQAQYDDSTAKLNIDQQLSSGFESGHRAAVLNHLETLPPGSLLILYKYCDHENAAYKNVALVFTVLLEDSSLESDTPLPELEEKVRDFLWQQFIRPGTIRSHQEMDSDKLSGVWSRISHLVLPVLPVERIEAGNCPFDHKRD